MTQTIAIHGVMLRIRQYGLLLQGDSGTGKSTIALGLINHGYQLVSDDCVELIRINHAIIAKAPSLLQNLLYTPDYGLINMKEHFGDNAVAPHAVLTHVISLDPINMSLAKPENTISFLGITFKKNHIIT